MKKFNPNKNIIIALITIIIIVTIVSVTVTQRTNKGKPNVAQSTLNDGVGLVDKIVSFPGKAITNGVSSVGNLAGTYEENQKLKSKIDEYGELKLQNDEYKKEIEALKQELQLNDTLSKYEKVTANVITRSPDTWQDLLIVDKGTGDGVQVNMAVMSQAGIIGRVIEVNSKSSKVELLTSKNQSANHFPVRISSSNGDAYGLVKTYDEKTQTLIATQLTGDVDIKEGDVVQTSGLGGNSPAYLPIGTVQKVKPDSFGLDREAYVKPYAKMDGSIKFVTIIKRMAEEG